MSKLRSISTSFWSDPFIEDLSPNEKLLFIYLITNERTNMLGIYEASTAKMSFETGIEKSIIEKALKGFERLNKVKYVNNYVVLVNYLKHQRFNTNMKKSAIDVYFSLPKELKDSSLNIDRNNPSEGFETLLNHYGMVRKIEVEVEDETEVEDEVEIEFKSKPLTKVTTSEVPLNEVEFYQIALNIQKKIKSNIEAAGGSTKKIEQAIYKTWVDPIRLMMSVDGVTREQINKAALFGLNDDFWKKNILSTTNFRKHFDKLILDSNGKKGNNQPTLKDDADYIQSIADRLGVSNANGSK